MSCELCGGGDEWIKTCLTPEGSRIVGLNLHVSLMPFASNTHGSSQGFPRFAIFAPPKHAPSSATS
jgi:hypothetical protein